MNYYFNNSFIFKMKEIPGFSNYSISENGKVIFTKTNTVVRYLKNIDKYTNISIKDDNGKRKQVGVHRLVALTYIPNPKNLPCVNHIDGTGKILNNHVSNLEWVTYKENSQHAIKTGLTNCYKRGVIQIDLDCNIIKEYNSIKEAGDATEIDPKSICKVCLKQRNMAGNFYWKYADDDEWKPTISKRIKKVEKINPDTNEIVHVYSGMKEICKLEHVSWATLKNIIDNALLFRNYYWKIIVNESFPNTKIQLEKKVENDDWKIIPNYSNYKISKKGEIYYITNKILRKPQLHKGYNTIVLKNEDGYKRFQIHRLVALVYLPNPENKFFILHIDGNLMNNNLENLEWYGNYSKLRKNENVRKIPYKQRKKNKLIGKCCIVNQYTIDGDLIETYKSIKEATEKLEIEKTLISKVCNRQGAHKLAGGYVWRFEGDDFDYKKDTGAIYQLDIDTEEIIGEFKSIKEAHEKVGMASKYSHIGAVCRGRRDVAYGYKWRFKYDEDINRGRHKTKKD